MHTHDGVCPISEQNTGIQKLIFQEENMQRREEKNRENEKPEGQNNRVPPRSEATTNNKSENQNAATNRRNIAEIKRRLSNKTTKDKLRFQDRYLFSYSNKGIILYKKLRK